MSLMFSGLLSFTREWGETEADYFLDQHRVMRKTWNVST